MKCFLLSRDLMFSSQAGSAANNAGLDTQTLASVGQVADQLAKDDQYVVLVDLTIPGLDIAATVEQLKRGTPAPTKLIAVGPHVQAGKLQAAKEAGCDLVLTKGQASQELGAVLTEIQRDRPN